MQLLKLYTEMKNLVSLRTIFSVFLGTLHLIKCLENRDQVYYRMDFANNSVSGSKPAVPHQRKVTRGLDTQADHGN